MGKNNKSEKDDGIVDGKKILGDHHFGLALGRIFSINGHKVKCTMILEETEKKGKEIGFVFQEDGKYRDIHPLSLGEVISDPAKYTIKSMKLSKSK